MNSTNASTKHIAKSNTFLPIFGKPLTKWTDFLSSDVYSRLSQCRSRKSDILPIAQARYSFLRVEATEFTKVDALIDALTILDCNNNDFDLTRDEWDNILSQII